VRNLAEKLEELGFMKVRFGESIISKSHGCPAPQETKLTGIVRNFVNYLRNIPKQINPKLEIEYLFMFLDIIS